MCACRVLEFGGVAVTMGFGMRWQGALEKSYGVREDDPFLRFKDNLL